jgi:hypothetical protein
MMQRTTIRGTYGISGGNENDCLISYFCVPCVILQSDREVRAREGNHNLRNDERYQTYKRSLENQQPPLQPPMAYISPRVKTDTIPGNSPRGTHEITLHSGHESPTINQMEDCSFLPFRKKMSLTSAHGSPSLSQMENSSSLPAHKKMSFTPAHGSPAMSQMEPSSPSPAFKKQDGNSTVSSFVSKLVKKRSSKLSSAHLSDGDEDGEILLTPQEALALDHQSLSRSSTVLRRPTIVTGLPQQGRNDIWKEAQHRTPPMDFSHGLRDCDVFSVKSTSGRHMLESGPQIETSQGTSQHRLLSCTGIGDGMRKTSGKNDQSQHKPSHSESVGSSGTIRQHPLEDCRRNTIPPRTSISQHGMAECAVAGQTNTTEKHSLSICENTNGVELEQKISDFRKTHALTFCENASQKTLEQEQPRFKDVPKAQSNGVDDNATQSQDKIMKRMIKAMTERMAIDSTSPAVNHTLTESKTSNVVTAQPQTSSSSHQLAESNVGELKKALKDNLAVCLNTDPAKLTVELDALEIREPTHESQETSASNGHGFIESAPKDSISNVAQNVMKECVMAAQHKVVQSIMDTGVSTSQRHGLVQCEDVNQATRSNTLVGHILAQDQRTSFSVAAQHKMDQCVTPTGVATPERHGLVQCEDVNQITRSNTLLAHSLAQDPRTSFSAAAQHKMDQCVTPTGIATPERHGLVQCEDVNQITRSNTLVARILADCDTNSRKSIIQHTLAECDLASGVTTPGRHSLWKCEATNQVAVPESLTVHNLADGEMIAQPTLPDKSSAAKRKLAQTLFEGSSDPVGFRARSAGGLMDRILGSRKTSPRPVNPRLTSCPVPASATSPTPAPDVNTSNHLPEKAQIDNRSESVPASVPQTVADQGEESSSSVSSGMISPKSRNISRRGTKQSQISQRERDAQAQKRRKDRSDRKESRVGTPEVVAKPAKASEPADVPLPATPLSNRSKWPSTVGPGFLSEKDRARLDSRRTQSELAHFSNDEEGEPVTDTVEELGKPIQTPNQGSGMTGFFGRLTGKSS